MDTAPEIEVHIVARGRVQGVNYRASLQREARARQLRGWVRNLSDGSVEAVLQGAEPDVDFVIAWARIGPRAAVVTGVQVAKRQPEASLTSFEIVG